MTEKEYIDRIYAHWPAKRGPTPRLLRLSAEAVRRYPRSPKLRCIHGDLLQLSAMNCITIRRKAVAHYRKALELNPACAEALEELGYALDILDDLDGAEQTFRRAVRLGGSPGTYSGLARVLSEKGSRARALRLLSPSRCPFHAHPEVTRRRREILDHAWGPVEERADRGRLSDRGRSAGARTRGQTAGRHGGGSSSKRGRGATLMPSVWISLLEVRPVPGNEWFKAKGAATNGLAWAESAARAEGLFEKELREYGFRLVRCESTELFKQRCAHWDVHDEVKKLATAVKRTHRTRFDRFQTWGSAQGTRGSSSVGKGRKGRQDRRKRATRPRPERRRDV